MKVRMETQKVEVMCAYGQCRGDAGVRIMCCVELGGGSRLVLGFRVWLVAEAEEVEGMQEVRLIQSIQQKENQTSNKPQSQLKLKCRRHQPEIKSTELSKPQTQQRQK